MGLMLMWISPGYSRAVEHSDRWRVRQPHQINADGILALKNGNLSVILVVRRGSPFKQYGDVRVGSWFATGRNDLQRIVERSYSRDWGDQ